EPAHRRFSYRQTQQEFFFLPYIRVPLAITSASGWPCPAFEKIWRQGLPDKEQNKTMPEMAPEGRRDCRNRQLERVRRLERCRGGKVQRWEVNCELRVTNDE